MKMVRYFLVYRKFENILTVRTTRLGEKSVSVLKLEVRFTSNFKEKLIILQLSVFFCLFPMLIMVKVTVSFQTFSTIQGCVYQFQWGVDLF
jgi:hypothetical protein